MKPIDSGERVGRPASRGGSHRGFCRTGNGALISGRRKPNPSSRRRGFLLLLVSAAIVTLVGGLATRKSPPVPQPIAFNHLRHTGDMGLACDLCHKYVRKGAHAGLPEASTCSMCHSSQQGESAESARVTELLEAGDPLRFNKLFQLADHVFYTHRRHVGIAELECSACHGAIAQTERPPERALRKVTMESCIDCHRERGQTLECNACHR